MNKTLLLVICDFLLLNLLALTRWEDAEPARPPPPPASEASSGQNRTTQDQDLVDVMKLSLEDERTQRQQLVEQLQSAQSSLQEREQNLSNLLSERTRLSSSLDQTQRNAAELAQRVEAASQDAAISKERLAQMQRELEKRREEAERQKQQLAQFEQQQSEARQKIESLNVAVKVAEQEKQMLRETAESFKTQVEQERIERQKVQATTVQLAQGVGQLAQRSNELTAEIRESRPINANTLFSDFLANRVQANLALFRSSFLGPINRAQETNTVFVSDGKQVYALLHVDDTPFSLRENSPDWEKINLTFSKGDYRAPASALHFLAVDPRVLAVPVEDEQVKAIGAKVYKTALEPFKFPEAVLISKGGAGYGEVAFKLDPAEPSYVRMDNRLMKRLFGNFSPSAGDLVLSKTGELLGIMVNGDYCAVVNNFLPAKTIKTGDAVIDQRTGTALDQLYGRLLRLPYKLQ